MLNPLIWANLKQDPTRIFRPAIAIAIATCALLARMGIVQAEHHTITQVAVAHWLSGLLTWVFWIAVIVSALERYTDVSERSSEFGLLRIFGASNSYMLSLVMQETALFAFCGALGGIGLAYFTSAVLQVVSDGLAAVPISVIWWPCAALLASLGSAAGAIVAIPEAIRDGIQQAL